MSVLSPDPSGWGVPGVLPLDRSIEHARRHVLRYRMAVVTHSTADLVNVAGGWLFDRVMAGWDVTVLAPDLSDPRPLRILGARVVDLRDAMAIRRARVVPQSYALSATVCATEERVHDWALSCLGRGGHEVTLWGEDLPDELGSRTTAAQHAPSRAARAFKARAMAAIADPARPIAEVETFRIAGRPRRGRGEPLPV